MKRSLPLLTLLSLLPFPALGQTESSWIGQRVMTHYGAVLKVGNQVVDDQKRSTSLAVSGHDRTVFRVYRVGRVNGPWLWLKAEEEGVEGWVKAEYVIPLSQAIDYFTNQIRANPSSNAWYISRGIVWREKGEYDIAIADYNEAIRLDPKEAAAFVCRGVAWSAKQDYEKAISDYSEAIRLDPKDAVAFLNRGVAWSTKQDYEKAISDCNEAIRLDPKFALAFVNRGLAWSAKQSYEKAISDFNEALRLDPKDALAFHSRGSAWGTKQAYEKAISDLSEAIRLNPKDAAAFSNRGLAWSAKQSYEKAISDFNEALRLDPKGVLTYSRRARLWATCPIEKHRDGKRAVESATRACELSEWKNAQILDTLAAAYAESGDFDRAVEWQEKAHELYPAEDKKELQKRLDLYRKKTPYRDEK